MDNTQDSLEDKLIRAFTDSQQALEFVEKVRPAIQAYVTEQVAAQTKNVTRFEVIDHRPIKDEFGQPTVAGRTVVAYGVNVELSYQDDDRTLKVFLGSPDGNKE